MYSISKKFSAVKRRQHFLRLCVQWYRLAVSTEFMKSNIHTTLPSLVYRRIHNTMKWKKKIYIGKWIWRRSLTWDYSIRIPHYSTDKQQSDAQTIDTDRKYHRELINQLRIDSFQIEIRYGVWYTFVKRLVNSDCVRTMNAMMHANTQHTCRLPFIRNTGIYNLFNSNCTFIHRPLWITPLLMLLRVYVCKLSCRQQLANAANLASNADSADITQNIRRGKKNHRRPQSFSCKNYIHIVLVHSCMYLYL